MTSTTTLPIFGKDTEPRPPTARLGMAAAAARLVAYRDAHTGELQAHLVAACPFCDHQHIHPAGPASAPRTCPRRSRCVGRPAGVYYFPEVAAW
ncbi:hypothetical protein ACFWEH_13050 [Streptomyces anulatus]|uniref:hypothetical protein n=1 Tax=Streptomyces TaxID=1883 RepID=UPI00093DBA26|nr:hypothetical protein [Streptomyces sp. TSRI0395]OKI83791.1 hypothetical protein AMK12_11760 [Streptomyces sp. TSRI0395]